MATTRDVLSFWFEDAARSPEALKRRSEVWFGIDPAFDRALDALGSSVQLFADYDDLVTALGMELRSGDQMVFMSNGGFGAVRQKLTMNLQRRATPQPDVP